MTAPGNDHFSRFATELANNLSLIAVLLDEHPATGDCTACRPPSSRVPIPAPCGVRAVAALALAIRTAGTGA
jgi:hypothetical protein